ncbi:MAG: hypothetical protein EA352_11030 [Gemmatimonadales bacterium]|nr:MAG: hypothetical protein EA352_11030 [Gemmatimonadales bacterium]
MVLTAAALLMLGVDVVELSGLQQPRSVTADSAGALRSAERLLYEYLHFDSSPRFRHLSAHVTGEYHFGGLVAAKHAARPAVLSQLDNLGDRRAADDWIVGQRAMLRIEHGLLEEALHVARTCQGTPWWCQELEGLVLHLLGETQAAESVFAQSLESMPPLERCFASDILFLTDELAWDRFGEPEAAQSARALAKKRYTFDRRRGYSEPICDEWSDVTHTFWWLADPFFLLPGNDRYTEHRSRIVATWLMAHLQMAVPDRNVLPGRPVYRGRWFGWLRPEHWEQAVRAGWPPRPYIASGWPPAAGNDSYGFDPGTSALKDPLGIESEDLRHNSPTTPGRYAPRYGPVAELEPQVAFFRRGESVEVAAALDIERADVGIAPGDSVLAGVVLALGPSDPHVVDSTRDVGPRHHFRFRVPDRRYLMSIEILGAQGGAGRARFSHGAPDAASDGTGISDLLLFEWDDRVSADLGEVTPYMLGSLRTSRQRPLGLYWETYAPDPMGSHVMSIRLVPEQRSRIRRLGERLRLVGSPEEVAFTWEEDSADRESGRAEHILRLGLENLRVGRYTVELSVRTSTHTLSTTRSLEVTG